MTFLEHYRQNRGSYRAILFDIDGTLLSHGKVATGVLELWAELDRDCVPYLILTNDAMHTHEEKAMLMSERGLEVNHEKIVSCGDILDELVKKNSWQGQKFFLLGRLGKPSFATAAGLEVCTNQNEIEECVGIINGEGYYNWHDHMQAAINFFRKNPSAPFIVPNPDAYFPADKGVGVGAGGQARFICAILKEMRIDIKPIYLGKPYSGIFDYVFNELKSRYAQLHDLARKEVMMLGDSLDSDIPGANNAAMQSGVVLTGITTPEMIALAKGEHVPKFVFEILA